MSADLYSKLTQAEQYLREGEPERARQLLARLVGKHGGDARLNQYLCLANVRLMQFEQAVYYGRRAVEIEPDSADLLVNLGNCLIFIAKVTEAMEVYQHALNLQPEHVGAQRGLAKAYFDAGQLSKAVESFQNVIKANPDDADAMGTLSTALCDMGHAAEAVAMLRRACEITPENEALWSNLASTLNYTDQAAPEEVYEAHRKYGELIARKRSAPREPVITDRNPDRPLRVGVLSADLRSHSVSFYARSLFEHLKSQNPGEFSIIAYFNHAEEDFVSRELRSMVDGWRRVDTLDDAALAAQIRQDRIDILIELAGHTMGERFGALALKPAPIQMTYIGYPNTTGMDAIDYRLVDSFTDPPGFADELATEKLLRLDPCFLCYSPLAQAPTPAPAPCLTNGFITFGSFNAISKLSPTTVRMWSSLVNATEDSRLILKSQAFRDQAVREEISERFSHSGLASDRVELLPPNASRANHLALYGRIDLGLDPYPYHGTTTTCEAFHMGVPVLCLVGNCHASRVGLSLNHAVGLGQLAAESEVEFVRIGSELARDHAAVAELRQGMRERLLKSVLCDGVAYGQRLGAALRSAWRTYARG